METGLVWLKHARRGFHPRPNKGARSATFLASHVGQRVTFSCFLKVFKTNFALRTFKCAFSSDIHVCTSVTLLANFSVNSQLHLWEPEDAWEQTVLESQL